MAQFITHVLLSRKRRLIVSIIDVIKILKKSKLSPFKSGIRIRSIMATIKFLVFTESIILSSTAMSEVALLTKDIYDVFCFFSAMYNGGCHIGVIKNSTLGGAENCLFLF